MYKKFKLSKKHFVVDVESDGPNIFRHNMISFGIVNIMNPELTFLGEVYPIHMNDGGVESARNVSGVSWEKQLTFNKAEVVMPAARKFITDITGGDRAIIWTDNPSYDMGWITPYMHEFTGDSICGFSGRRIGDLYSGLIGNPFKTKRWKGYRRAPHNHCPVSDALGNAQALRVILGIDSIENKE